GTDVFGNSVSLTTTTDALGFYQFANLVPGVYNLAETQPTIPGTNPPALYLDGREENGTPPAAAVANDLFTGIDLTVFPFLGGGYNFGELRPASLAGFVYIDANGNGVRDPNEPGVAGVTVTLTGTDDRGAAVNVAVVTDANGNYRFDRIRPGTYTLTETQPVALNDGVDSAGAGVATPGVAGNDRITGIVLAENQNGVNFRFGEAGLRSQFVSKRRFLNTSNGQVSVGPAGSGVANVKPIASADPSGYVYVDINGNGVRDPGEPGISGVLITLIGTTITRQKVRLTKLTDANGFYQFDELLPGTYSIIQTQPSGYRDGRLSLGTLGGTVGRNKFSNIVLRSGDNGTDYNFGELPLAPVSKKAIDQVFATMAQNEKK
ncbi:MAG: carboxypeptidase regulatory-like domain-containing protein, partial [Gemmataceae bacterium]|nr:carboxypeptidase regulatory-like domain-containing protein [Gemmataceae bacterium]